jgi:uncharacterized integral membrane protein
VTNHFKEFDMGKNSKSWTLWVGVLLIITACVIAYITTKPDEANVSFIGSPFSLTIVASTAAENSGQF